MKHSGWKWALGGAAIALLIVYGLDTADGGINNVYGPVGAQNEAPAVNANGAVGSAYEGEPTGAYTETQNETGQTGYAQQQPGSGDAAQVQGSNDRQSYAYNERLPGVPYETDKPTVDRLADSAAGVLQTVSSGGIKLFVSMFDGIMD